MKKINVYINDNYCIRNDLSDEAFLVYLGLRQLFKQGVSQYYVSVGLLSYILSGVNVSTRSITSYIMQGLEDLDKNKEICKTSFEKIRKHNNSRKYESVYNLKKLHFNAKEDKVYYTVIDSDTIVQLVNDPSKSKLQLLRFYCYLMTTIMKTKEKKGVGFTSYQDMANKFKITRQTVSTYMNKLEEFGIIYIYRSNDTIVYSDGKIREISNVYGDRKDKKKIIACGIQYERDYGKNNVENIKLVNKSKAKSTRSASAKYNVILGDLAEGGKIRYDDDECKDIYEVLLEFNKRYSYDENRQKDLSIFKDYDFYKGL